MMRTGKLNIGKLPDRGVSEPRKILEGRENLPALNEKPEPVRRDVGDFNG